MRLKNPFYLSLHRWCIFQRNPHLPVPHALVDVSGGRIRHQGMLHDLVDDVTTMRFDDTLLLASTSHRIRSGRSEEHTSELQSRENLVCRLLLEKKKTKQ